MPYNWFPLGLASGKAFCNRERERKQLSENFQAIRHSLLVSPRRYGKTSLVLQSIKDSKRITTKVDFFSVMSIEAAQQRILDGVGELIPQMITKTEQALRLCKSYLKRFHFSLQYKEIGFSIGLKPTETNVTQSIVAALNGLERIAHKMQQHIVLFFDEVQTIGLLEQNIVIEGAIREAAQASQYVAYVFSGSNPRLLRQLFDERTRPLYLLCQRISIDRIEAEAYRKHLQKAAKDTWKTMLEDTVIDTILKITEHHPYYVNALCARLWTQKVPPTEDQVLTSWTAYAEEEKSRISGDLDQITYNQRKLLVAIAKVSEMKEPTSRLFLTKSGLSSASSLQSLKTLLKKDYLEQTHSGAYRLIDPLMRTLLSR